jgi:hypothetical protein
VALSVPLRHGDAVGDLEREREVRGGLLVWGLERFQGAGLAVEEKRRLLPPFRCVSVFVSVNGDEEKRLVFGHNRSCASRRELYS